VVGARFELSKKTPTGRAAWAGTVLHALAECKWGYWLEQRPARQPELIAPLAPGVIGVQ